MNTLGANISNFTKDRKKKWNLNLICKMGINLVLIIHKIHERGYVHRDINPRNIMLGKNDNWNDIHLIDYSLAKLIPKD